jgi:hypothetical protein
MAVPAAPAAAMIVAASIAWGKPLTKACGWALKPSLGSVPRRRFQERPLDDPATTNPFWGQVLGTGAGLSAAPSGQVENTFSSLLEHDDLQGIAT